MAEVRWDVKRGYGAYFSVTTKQLGLWIQEGRVKKGDVLVWRSGLGSFRSPEELDEFRLCFRDYRKKQSKPIEKKFKPKIHNIRRICVIDDEIDLGNFLVKLLNEKKYQAHATSDSKKVWRYLEKEKPDLIFLDEKIGNASGVKMLPHIRKLCPRANIVMISAYGTPELKQEAYIKGAVGFIDKPFSFNKILATIKVLSKAKKTPLRKWGRLLAEV